MIDRRAHTLVRMEIRQCFSVHRIPIFVLIILAAIFAAVQESELSPMFIVLMSAFAVLESYFNNILYHAPNEFEVTNLFPISWRQILLLKNVTAIFLLGLVSFIISLPTLYFSPKAMNGHILLDGILYALTIVFLLLHVGNRESVHNPRRSSGWDLGDLASAAGTFMFITVLSFPYIIFSIVLKMEWLSIAYSIATGWFWYTRSIPATAAYIENFKTVICAKS